MDNSTSPALPERASSWPPASPNDPKSPVVVDAREFSLEEMEISTKYQRQRIPLTRRVTQLGKLVRWFVSTT